MNKEVTEVKNEILNTLDGISDIKILKFIAKYLNKVKERC